MNNFDLRKYLAEGKLLKENENNLGMSLESLPKKIKRNMSYEFDFNTPEYNSAITMLQKFLQKNLTKLEDGKSIYSISNQGEDLKEIAKLLEITPTDIIDYINMAIDEILGYY